MGSNCTCNLTLGFSTNELDDQNNKYDQQIKQEKNTLVFKYDDHILPSLSLGLLQSKPPLLEVIHGIETVFSPDSSHSNSSKVKKEKVAYEENDFEVEKAVLMRASDDDDEEASPRKKLRLSKEQSAVLEDSFKDHVTLNPIEKQALSRQLNLRPRQVEVWFQNRRARTKLKQTEIDFEFLKKCCQSLTEENIRLHKEVQQLKAFKFSPAHVTTFFMQMPAATLTICPACERISATDGGGVAPSKPSVVIKPKARLYSSRFAHTSAAC